MTHRYVMTPEERNVEGMCRLNALMRWLLGIFMVTWIFIYIAVAQVVSFWSFVGICALIFALVLLTMYIDSYVKKQNNADYIDEIDEDYAPLTERAAESLFSLDHMIKIFRDEELAKQEAEQREEAKREADKKAQQEAESTESEETKKDAGTKESNESEVSKEKPESKKSDNK